MRGTIKRLFGSSLFLLVCSAACLYAGSVKAAGASAANDLNPLARQFGGDPGDGWMLAGGLLVVVALAFASAGAMLWFREREG
jgi:ABC-type Na+ efflux pump permease subunit